MNFTVVFPWPNLAETVISSSEINITGKDGKVTSLAKGSIYLKSLDFFKTKVIDLLINSYNFHLNQQISLKQIYAGFSCYARRWFHYSRQFVLLIHWYKYWGRGTKLIVKEDLS